MTEDFIAKELKDFLADSFPEGAEVFPKYEHDELYDFEFSFLPKLVANMNEHPEDGAYAALLDNPEEAEGILIDRWLENLSDEKESCPTCFVEPQDYKVLKQHFPKSGKECLLIEFPEPDDVPLAKYGLISLNAEGKYIYFTLEISLSYQSKEIIWFLCSADVNSHSNFGTLDDEPTIMNFMEAVETLINIEPYS